MMQRLTPSTVLLSLAGTLLAASSFAGGLAAQTEPDYCVAARVRATMPNGETVIIEDTPIGLTFEEADKLALAECKKDYPLAECKVAGHAIVDCPEGP